MDDLTGTLDEPTTRVISLVAADRLNCNLRDLGMEQWSPQGKARLPGSGKLVVTVFEVPVSVARQVTELPNWDYPPGEAPTVPPPLEPMTDEPAAEDTPPGHEDPPAAGPGCGEEPTAGGGTAEPDAVPAGFPAPAPPPDPTPPAPPSPRPRAKRKARGRPKPATKDKSP